MRPKNKNNSEEIFVRLYETFADAVFRHCYFRVSDRERAKDIVQETFKRLWTHVAGGGSVENEKAFIFTIANHLIIDLYRRKKEESLDTLQENGFDVGTNDHEAILSMISGKELMTLLDGLDTKYRDVVVMRYIDDLPVQQISKIVGESENAVSVRIHRGLKKIKSILIAQDAGILDGS